MSYILEALKKSEEQRLREQTPSQLHSLQPAHVPRIPEKSIPVKRWFYIASAFIGFGCLSIYLTTFITKAPEPQQLSRVTIQPLAVQSTFDSSSSQKQQPSNKEVEIEAPKATTSQKQSLEAETEQSSKQEGADKILTAQIAEEPREVLEPAPLPTESEVPVSISVPLESSARHKSIPLLEQLSPSFQKKVPQLKLAGHVYSQDPNLRLILINNSIVREKDIVANDFILEEITPDGIILRSGDTRFRLISD